VRTLETDKQRAFLARFADMVSSVTSALYCYSFLPSLYMIQVPEKLYLGQWQD